MALPHFAPRQVVPYVISGATGAHIFARLWRLSRAPARKIPLHLFLARHSDVMLVLCSAHVVVWRLAKRHDRNEGMQSAYLSDTLPSTVLHERVHELRQVFTALLLGLGMISRRFLTNKADTIPNLVQRLRTVVTEGIDLVNALDAAADQTRSAG